MQRLSRAASPSTAPTTSSADAAPPTPPATPHGEPQVAFLRGVNVSGARPLPMAAFRTLLEDTPAFSDVQTYIQSGNAVFRAAGPPSDSAAHIRTLIADTYGYDVPVAVRTGADLAAVVRDTPFPGAAESGSRGGSTGGRPRIPAAQLDPDAGGDDAFVATPTHVYLSLTNGVARTTLSVRWFESVLGVQATMRNWRTVKRMADMAAATAAAPVSA